MKLRGLKKVWLLFLVLSAPVLACAQLSADSLKRISVRKYNMDYMRNRDATMSVDTIYVRAWEIYSGIFSNIKAFAVSQSNCDDCVTETYIFDIRSGKRPDMKNIESFNNEMNKCLKPLINFDKSCFYLLLNDISRIITPSSVYSKCLVKGSVFKGLPKTELLFYSVPMSQWEASSSKGKMYIGTLNYDRQQDKMVEAIYEFKYNVHGQLVSVITVNMDEFVPPKHWNADWAPFLPD